MDHKKLAAIVRAVQDHTPGADTQLYEAVSQELYYYILKTVNDPHLADDLLQDTFLDIYQNIGKLQAPEAFVSWSRQIAHSRCTDYGRKRHDLLVDEDEDGKTVLDNLPEDRTEFIPHEALEIEDLKQTLHTLIDTLPPEQRSALMLRYFDEISVKEIAQIQNVSEGTVKSRLNYARNTLRKSVEDYEKKHDIKLHSVGIIPLLLWLFREFKVANSLSLTHAATAAAPAFSATVAAESTAASAAASVAATAAKGLSGKLIAGIAAASIAAGGVVAAVVIPKNETPAPPATTVVQTQVPTTSAPTLFPTQYCGYGTIGIDSQTNHRYELTVYEQTASYIRGYLDISQKYKSLHQTGFEGTGIWEEGQIKYHLIFETEDVISDIPDVTRKEVNVIYDPETDSFSLNDMYHVTFRPVNPEDDRTSVTEVRSWSGLGEDCYYSGFKSEDHLFQIQLSGITKTRILGKLTVSYEGKVDHETTFVGRGIWLEDHQYYRYEVRLDNPRKTNSALNNGETLWLYYNPEKGTLSSSAFDLYKFVLSPAT